MSPWKYPNRIDTGRNMMSLGFLMKRPTSLTTLVNPKTKMIWAQKAYWRLVGSQSAVAFHREKMMNGSITKARDVKVAICSAYVHQSCWL